MSWRFFQKLPPCLVGIEACASSHHWSRELQALGHTVRLMPAAYVKPYVKRQKNDVTDAEAICEAVTRPNMRFVPTKTVDQLDLQALHRVRERLVSQRTGIINQIRAFLLERGIAVRQGLRFLRLELPGILATRADVLSPRMMRVLEGLSRAGRDEGTVLGARVLTGQRSSDLDRRQGKCRRAALTQCHCLENPAFAPLVVLHIAE